MLALARIDRKRDQAALRFARERDLGRLEATMARLDVERRLRWRARHGRHRL